jgi:endonuclease YncB( thermonuclease family)
MIAKSKPKNSWFTVLLVIAAVALWAYNQSQPPAAAERRAPRSQASAKEPANPPGKAGAYEFYQGCTLAEARNNDGDSFLVKLPDGKKAEFRLYFVDTPESAFKSYAGGDTNHQRIREQAADLGGITPEQAVEIGKKAKAYSLGLLAGRPFDLHTSWDSPFNDNRFHAFVEVKHDGKPRWLHEILVEKGLARIHTKGADLPDATSSAKHKARLKELEGVAKRTQTGAWGL